MDGREDRGGGGAGVDVTHSGIARPLLVRQMSDLKRERRASKAA